MSGRGRLYKGDREGAAGPGGRGSLCPCAHVSPEVRGAVAPLTPAWHPAGPPGRRTCCRCRPGCSRCSSTPRQSWGRVGRVQCRAQGQQHSHCPVPRPCCPWNTPTHCLCPTALSTQCHLSNTDPGATAWPGPPSPWRSPPGARRHLSGAMPTSPAHATPACCPQCHLSSTPCCCTASAPRCSGTALLLPCSHSPTPPAQHTPRPHAACRHSTAPCPPPVPPRPLTLPPGCPPA